MPEKKLTKENYENLPRMIEETCVAAVSYTHLTCFPLSFTREKIVPIVFLSARRTRILA